MAGISKRSGNTETDEMCQLNFELLLEKSRLCRPKKSRPNQISLPFTTKMKAKGPRRLEITEVKFSSNEVENCVKA